MEITADTLSKAKNTCLLPVIVQKDPLVAQITFDFSLIVTMMGSLFFTPFLTYLVFI
jgi:hypothetical protein